MPVIMRVRPPFTVSEQAVKQAREIGLCGEVEKRLARMAKRSAPLTHEEGNRRFGDFVLMVSSDRKVLAVNRL
jgi:hypothetical protein